MALGSVGSPEPAGLKGDSVSVVCGYRVGGVFAREKETE